MKNKKTFDPLVESLKQYALEVAYVPEYRLSREQIVRQRVKMKAQKRTRKTKIRII